MRDERRTTELKRGVWNALVSRRPRPKPAVTRPPRTTAPNGVRKADRG